MNPKEIAMKVAEAIELDRKIARLTEELNGMKAELIEAAKQVPARERSRTECGGWSALLAGARGEPARVSFPASKLKSELSAKSEEWKEIAEIIGPLKMLLFTTETYKVPARSIRENILSIGPEKAKRVLKLVTSKSKPSVSFETKEVAA